MVELGISTFGEITELEGTGQTYSHAERIRQLVAEIELADKVGGRIWDWRAPSGGFCSISPRDCPGRWGSQHQENPFDQCSQHSVKHGPDSFVPTVCHYRCFVKWTIGDYGWKGLFHGIFPSVWL